MYPQNAFNSYPSPYPHGYPHAYPTPGPSSSPYAANISPQQNAYAWHQHSYVSPHMYGYSPQVQSPFVPPSFHSPMSSAKYSASSSHRDPHGPTMPFIPPSPSSGMDTPGPTTPAHPHSYPRIHSPSGTVPQLHATQAPKHAAPSVSPLPQQSTSPRHHAATMNDRLAPPGTRRKGFMSYNPPSAPVIAPLTAKGKWYLQCAGISEEEMHREAQKLAQKWREEGLWCPGHRSTSPSTATESSYNSERSRGWDDENTIRREQEQEEYERRKRLRDEEDEERRRRQREWQEKQERRLLQEEEEREEQERRRQEVQEREEQEQEEQSEGSGETTSVRTLEDTIAKWRLEAETSTPEEWEADMRHWMERRDAYIARTRCSSENTSQTHTSSEHDSRGRTRRPKALTG